MMNDFDVPFPVFTNGKKPKCEYISRCKNEKCKKEFYDDPNKCYLYSHLERILDSNTKKLFRQEETNYYEQKNYLNKTKSR